MFQTQRMESHSRWVIYKLPLTLERRYKFHKGESNKLSTAFSNRFRKKINNLLSFPRNSRSNCYDLYFRVYFILIHLSILKDKKNKKRVTLIQMFFSSNIYESHLQALWIAKNTNIFRLSVYYVTIDTDVLLTSLPCNNPHRDISIGKIVEKFLSVKM